MMRILIITVSFILAACSPIFSASDCADKLLYEATSSDGKTAASLIQRNCGATTAYANIVYLRKVDGAKEKNEVWGEKIYVSQGETEISLTWKGSELRIKAPTSGPSVFLKRDEWMGLKIVYE